MKYMLLMHYQVEGVAPIGTWAPEDIKAHIEFQHELNRELTERAELVDAQGLSELVTVVTADGLAAPVVSDGPFPEAKEFLAGYRTVDVESPERALEIAAAMSAAPGPDGIAIRQPIEVRQVMGAPSTDT
jgi:hypothetical protein